MVMQLLKYPVVVVVLAGAWSFFPASAQNDLAAPSDGPVAVEVGPSVSLPGERGWDLLYDNGPIVNSAGTGVGGRDESVLQNVTLGMSTLGFDSSVSSGWRIADDFSAADVDMHPFELYFYAYQTGAGPGNQTIDGINICIWKGEPGNGGVLHWGDCSTNVLADAEDAGILRVTEETSGTDDDRAVFRLMIDYFKKPHFSIHTYWMDIQIDGSLDEGPYTPPVTITGDCETGNAIQSFDNGATWVPAVDEATGCGQAIPFQIYGFFWIPVELTSFNATLNGTHATLQWTTVSETNNAGFEVQVQNGEDWEVLGFVDGNGTTTEAHAYSFDVGELAVGAHVFRLKQIDYDGAFEYSDELEVTVETPGTHVLTSAYPNPFNPQSQFTLAVAQDQHVTAELFNTLGQRIAVLFSGTVEANQAQLVTIDGAGLASGMYLVRVIGERFSDAIGVTLLK